MTEDGLERWRGTVDEKLRTIERDGKSREVKIDKILTKIETLDGVLRFARGSLFVTWPILVFLAVLLLNHLITARDNIAVIPKPTAVQSDGASK